jgi:hypothetical protein
MEGKSINLFVECDAARKMCLRMVEICCISIYGCKLFSFSLTSIFKRVAVYP